MTIREDQLNMFKQLAKQRCKGYTIDGKAYAMDDNFCGDKGLKWAEKTTDEAMRLLDQTQDYKSNKEGPLPGGDYMKDLASDSFNSLHRREPTRGNTNRQQAPVECVLPDRKKKETDTSICYPVALDTNVMDNFDDIEKKVKKYYQEFLDLKNIPTEDNLKKSSTDKENADVTRKANEIVNKLRTQYEKAKLNALEYKAYITKKNDVFLNKKDEFIDTTNKLNLKKSDNLASQLLKIDIYDRNIEDNIYIIYYLLSYGIMGYFIYKLLK